MTMQSFAPVLWIGLGGALGSIARYAMATGIMQWTGLAQTGRFPLGTLLVNLLGCLLIGVMAGLAQRFDWLTPAVRLFIVTGVLGGFTTFSAFGLETVELMQRNQWFAAGLYLGSSVALGLLAVWLGMQIALPGARP